jgi:Tfp pilus assembly protein PilF
MNRHLLSTIAILTAALTAPACGHVPRIELPEQMTRVERKTSESTPVVPVVHTPDPDDPKSRNPEVPLSRNRQADETQQAQRLLDGLAALTQGETQAAIALGEELVRADPHNGRAHCLLGIAYLQLDEARGVSHSTVVAMATEELRRTLSLIPDYPPALYYLGMAAVRRGDAAAAHGYLDGLRAAGRATTAANALERAIGDGSSVLIGELN